MFRYLISIILYASILIFLACSHGSSGEGKPYVEVNIRYLSSDDTTDHMHVIMQGDTTFHHSTPNVTWHNELTGASGEGVSFSEPGGCSVFIGGCAADLIYFEVDVPLQYGDNPIKVVVSAGGVSGSDSITITRSEDIDPPSLRWVDPADNSVFVNLDTDITLGFNNEEIDSSTLNSETIRVYDYNGNILSGTYEIFTDLSVVDTYAVDSSGDVYKSHSGGEYCGRISRIQFLGGHEYGSMCDENMRVRFIPDEPLQVEKLYLSGETILLGGYTYTIYVSGMVSDLAGNAMVDDSYFRFSTGSNID